MGRYYVCQFEDVAVTAAQDLFEVAAPSTGIVVIHKWVIFQTTDTGDAAEEILEIETVRGDGSVTSGSGGSTDTPEPIDNGDAAAGSTVESEFMLEYCFRRLHLYHSSVSVLASFSDI